MKIVIKKDENETRCLVQLRDIKYIAQRYDSNYFEDFYMSEMAKGHKDHDFIEITNQKVKDLVIKCPFIIDFTDFVRLDPFSLSRIMVLSNTSANERDQADNEHKIRDLQDILEFKKGSLGYRIPVAFDNKVYLDLGPVYFGTTTIPGYYMLKKKNINANLMDFLYNYYYLLYTFVDDKNTCDGFESFRVGEEVVFKFNTKTKLQSVIEGIKKKFS